MQTPLDIALVRVDSRLVHGQLLEAWVPYLKATCLIVVDNEVATDFFRESVIRMSVPPNVEVMVSAVSDFPSRFFFRQGDGRKTIVLLSAIGDALTVHRLGFRFTKLNIDNIYNEPCRLHCTPSVLLSDLDLEAIDALHSERVGIELRRVPREKPNDFYDLAQHIKC